MADKRKASVHFSEDIKPTVRHQLFAAIEAETSINEGGNVTWTGFQGVNQYISVLHDAFSFPEDISRREASGIVHRGLMAARVAGKLSDSLVLEAIQRITDARLSEHPRRFSLWTRLSFRPTLASHKVCFEFDGVAIELRGGLPPYLQLTESDLAHLRPHRTKDTPGYGYLLARTTARNATQASDGLFGAIELFQAVFNLALKQWNIMGSEQRPEATLLMGPYQFLFRGRTSLLDQFNWYNPNFKKDFWTAVAVDFDKLQENVLHIRKGLAKLQSHPLREPLSTAFLMMNDGMESADMTRRTLRYWTALERLFQRGDERVGFDKIIRRATYLDDPPDLARAKLARLMRIRNRYVHMGHSENEHHQLTQWLASEVRSHLFYLLYNGDDFADHGEFIEMTDLPSDRASLERRRIAIERRERMTEHRRHRSD